MESRQISGGRLRPPVATTDRPAGSGRRSHASDSVPPMTAASEGTAGSVGLPATRRAHVLLGVGGRQTTSDTTDGRPPSKRVRKERGPNWSAQEVKALIEAKRKLHELEKSTTNERELMIPEARKWQRISDLVQEAGHSPCVRDGFACKSKWNQVIPDYKRIADYVRRSGTKDTSYWHLSFPQRRQEGLPRTFPREVFWSIHDWYGNEPAMLPAHGRDLLEVDDSSFQMANTASDEDMHLDGSHDGSPIRPTQYVDDDDSDSLNASTDSPRSVLPEGRATLLQQQRFSSRSASPQPQRKGSLPPGVVPQLISSSEAGSPVGVARAANTGVRRKSISGLTLIAEATKMTGTALTSQMRDAAEVSRDIEKSKIEMQVRQFDEQMAYQKDRDKRLSDNARITNDNAKLSILKQGDVVQALSSMTSVLSAAFLQRPHDILPRSTDRQSLRFGDDGVDPTQLTEQMQAGATSPSPSVDGEGNDCN